MVVRTLVVWCPDWPVIAATAGIAGAAPSDPVAVVHANRVVAASPGARAEGVRPGQRRREAQAHCPDLVVIERDGIREARAFDPVVRALEDVTPLIELQRPGVCAFATRGPSRYFGGDEALADLVWTRVDAVLAGMGWAGHIGVGIGDGPFTALLAARAGTGTRNGTRTRVRVVPPQATAAFLAAHPVEVLALAGVSSELGDVLVRLGLVDLGAFARLDPGDVVARFGVQGQRAYRLARGLDEFPPAAVAPPPELTVTTVIDPPADRVDQATFAAKMLADELHDRLEHRGLACTRVCIVAETEHGERLERLWRHEGTLTPVAMVERVRWQLDGWLTGSAASRPTAGVSSISLVPDQVTAAHGHQFGLWGGRSEADARATRAMTRVQGLLAHDAVVVPRPGGGRGPAESVVMVPFMADDPDLDTTGSSRSSAGASSLGASPGVSSVGHSSAGRSSAGASFAEVERNAMAAMMTRDDRVPWPGQLPAPPPARVYAVAPAASMLDAAGAPVRVSGRGMLTAEPARLAIDGGPWCAVDAWSAPWPLDERWWDPKRHRRRARMQIVVGGTAHILSLEGGRWRVEATYD